MVLTATDTRNNSPFVTRIERDDRAWVEALRAGGSAMGQAEVVADLRDFLRRTLAKGFGQQLAADDLEDLAQESLLRVHGKLDTFREQSRFTTWAATIAINCAVSELRRRRFEHVSIDVASENVDWSPSEADAGADEEQVALLRRGIAEALTDKQREAIHAVLGGLPLTELARRWDVSQGAVYKLLHDARRRLKGYLESAERRQRDASAKRGIMSDKQKAVEMLRTLLEGTRDEEIDCDRFLELLAPLLDERIDDPKLRELLAHHIRQCAECNEEFEIAKRALARHA